MNQNLKDQEQVLDKMLATLSPTIKMTLVNYLLALESNSHELLTTQVDDVKLRREQGRALAFKDLIKKFT